MPPRSSLVTRLRARALYPALAIAAGISALAGGLERTRFLGSPIAAESAANTDSADAHLPAIAGSALGSAVSLAAAGIPSGTAATAAANGLDLDVEHSRIDKWVARITTSARGDFQQSLDRMDQYAGMITRKLDARGMPRELIYLALIESNFNPTAKSRVKAVGLWQFMGATARQFGLTVRGGVDDRKDPAKATDAALSYLSDLHDRFGSWYLAAAAYNSGQGTVSKALRTVLGKTTGTDDDFFRILSHLPKETQDYVPKLIASARVGSEPEKYGLQ